MIFSKKNWLTAFFCLFGLWTVHAQKGNSIAKVTMTVSDLPRAVSFYSDVLGFHPVDTIIWSGAITQQLFDLDAPAYPATLVVLQLGDEQIELMAFGGNVSGRPVPGDSRSNDLWFQHIAIVVNDMDLAYRRVSAAGVEHVSTAPQTLPASLPAAAGITASYFRDPDGHNLELIHFPPGKGNPKWQTTQAEPLFLGVDHTAIGIGQTGPSLDYYTGPLHLTVGGRSENFGTEQEHLNQVFGARLLITGLHGAAGFGLEFLDYIAPPGGRPYPADSKATDLWHWHTTLHVEDLSPWMDPSSPQAESRISKDIVHLPEANALAVRDPDGHVMLLEVPSSLPVK